jgi:hypothetical protein
MKWKGVRTVAGKVKREYYLPGARYSQNKDSIKAVFKKHGLKWAGSMEFPRWKSGCDDVIAEFLRENEVTVGAKLKYEGDPLGAFCLELTQLLSGLGAEYEDTETLSSVEVDNSLELEIEDHMKLWDRANKPNLDAMRRGSVHNGYRPVPEAFLNAAIRDFKERHDAEEQRFRAEQAKGNAVSMKPREEAEPYLPVLSDTELLDKIYKRKD